MSKYRIENLVDITDSKEILQSSPKGFSKYMTYIILLLIIIVIIWSTFAEKEISIQASGVVRPSIQTNNLSSNIQGTITEVRIKDGDEVKNGEILIVVDGAQYELQRNLFQQNLDKRNREKELVTKLKESISEGINKFDESIEDEKEYSDKYKLYDSNSSTTNSTNSINETQKNEISKKISDLQLLKKGIEQSTNYFKEGDTLYYQYNNYILEVQKLDSSIKTCENNINELENKKITTDVKEPINSSNSSDATDTIDIDDTTETTVPETIISNENNNDELNKQIETIKTTLESYKSEKVKLKNSTVMNITSQIDQYKLNLSQLQTPNASDMGAYKEQYLLNLDANLSTIESTIDEIEMNLETINSEIEARSIKSTADGVINMISIIKVGDVIQNGSVIASIIPMEKLNYNIEVAIPNHNFGEITEEQEVSIELLSLPASQYGYISSKLENISIDTKVNQEDGTSYYTAICSMDKKTFNNKKGESVDIKNGMLANVRIINRRVTYFKYFLEKIDILK